MPEQQKVLDLVFRLSLAGAGLAYFALVKLPSKDTTAEKVATAVFVACALAMVIDYDVLAFTLGAFATISQVILGWQRAVPVVVPGLVAVAAVLSGHLTVAHVPGQPHDWRAIAAWSLVYAAEVIALAPLGATLFAQAPNQD